MKWIATTALCLLAACTTEIADDDPDTEVPDSSDAPPVSISDLARANNTQTAFDFFVHKGLKKVQAAGIVGNLIQESSVDPNAIEYGGGPGRGIAQWSVDGRWNESHDDNVTWYANTKGLNRWALGTQLDFIWYELTTHGYGYASLKGATTASAAAVIFEEKYELCGTCDQSKRIAYAQQVLADYGK